MNVDQEYYKLLAERIYKLKKARLQRSEQDKKRRLSGNGGGGMLQMQPYPGGGGAGAGTTGAAHGCTSLRAGQSFPLGVPITYRGRKNRLTTTP